MGDQGGGGLGTDLQGLASQWGGSAPANDRYPLFQPDPPERWARPVTNPPANDPGLTPQGQLNQLSDDDLMAQHRQTVADHQKTHSLYRRLRDLMNGASPHNYYEATVVQQNKLDELHQRTMGKLVNSDKLIDEQRHNFYKRGMVSPYEDALKQDKHMPTFPDPKPGSQPRPRFVATPGVNLNDPGPPSGNPMSPLARPPMIGLEHRETEQPSGLPRELSFGRPANENQPPVE